MKIAVAAAAAHLECAQRSLDAWTRDGDLATLLRPLSECESMQASQTGHSMYPHRRRGAGGGPWRGPWCGILCRRGAVVYMPRRRRIYTCHRPTRSCASPVASASRSLYLHGTYVHTQASEQVSKSVSALSYPRTSWYRHSWVILSPSIVTASSFESTSATCHVE